jgi:hypothetical protein
VVVVPGTDRNGPAGIFTAETIVVLGRLKFTRCAHDFGFDAAAGVRPATPQASIIEDAAVSKMRLSMEAPCSH